MEDRDGVKCGHDSNAARYWHSAESTGARKAIAKGVKPRYGGIFPGKNSPARLPNTAGQSGEQIFPTCCFSVIPVMLAAAFTRCETPHVRVSRQPGRDAGRIGQFSCPILASLISS
ncbi:MAG: hypothetical protein LBI92_06285 [Azoarcus sp.]|jgi:hypothetical protein|nr:hypothetical protein [Azoarcus sp.]